MRVLHFYRTYFPDTQGGLEEAIRQICLNTIPEGIASQILTLSPDPSPVVIERAEATVVRARLHGTIASCSVSLQAAKQLRALSGWADIVHYHFPWPFADLLHFWTRIRKPSVVTYHSDIVRQRLLKHLYEPLQNRFLRSVDRIVCTSPNYFATSDVLSRFEHKVEVIPIGIDESTYPEPGADELAATEAAYGRDFFLFVGVLRYYKGLHVLLNAIQGAPYRVVIVGSGPTELELKRQARELGLSNVVFAGYLPDEVKIRLLKLCRGVVFPSYMRSEAFGVTLVEGAIHGKPMISTEVGSGTSHVNVHGETGLVVPPGSPRELRQAMDQIWHRPDMARLMGRKARQRYERLFTGKLMGKRYARLYRDLAGLPQQDGSAEIAEGAR